MRPVVQERVRGQEYDELIDELIAALKERYGARMLLHWEDFNVRNSFRLLDKYVARVMLQSLCQSVFMCFSQKLSVYKPSCASQAFCWCKHPPHLPCAKQSWASVGDAYQS